MESKTVFVADILKAISDKISLELFRTVGLTKPDTNILISKTNLARKQYYSRMSSMMNAGLITGKMENILWQGDLPHDINNDWKRKWLFLET